MTERAKKYLFDIMQSISAIESILALKKISNHLKKASLSAEPLKENLRLLEKR